LKSKIYFIFVRRVKLKRIINLTKSKKKNNKKRYDTCPLKSMGAFKILLKNQEQKLGIKRIRTKVDIPINQRIIMDSFMGNVIFKVRREKSGRIRKKKKTIDITLLTQHHLVPPQQENDDVMLPITL